MAESGTTTLDAIIAKDVWTIEDYQALRAAVAQGADTAGKIRGTLRDLESADAAPKGTAALKIGILRYMLCRFPAALDVLANATDNKDRHYFQALCLKHLYRYAPAREEIQRAKDRGADAQIVDLEQAEIEALAGDVDAASKTLAKYKTKLAGTAELLYLTGLIAELAGRGSEAIEAYEQAHQTDPEHTGALFRMAYYYDLHGDEEHALELYLQCLKHPPIQANALINLATLYEDAGQYDLAGGCLRRLLASNPDHLRARLFLKDVEASKTMYYDEDQARRIAHRNAILDIPVTDFELSVRARNCLKKMNIRTLGDLIRTTEAELMSYKNFGETSLREIKTMLAAKGLRLGQALEEESGLLLSLPTADEAQVKNEGVLATPVDQIPFSKRARKALENLHLKSLGELTSKTEAELLACENFGQTSLNEVRQHLQEYGLSLREPD